MGTPSGRPGSYPWASITANVTNPNEIDLGTAESDGSQVIVPAGSKGVVRLNNPILEYSHISTNCPGRIAKLNGSPKASHLLDAHGLAMQQRMATGSCEC